MPSFKLSVVIALLASSLLANAAPISVDGRLARRNPEPEVFEEFDLHKRDTTSTASAPHPTSTTLSTTRKGGLRSVGCSKLGEEARSKARSAAKAYISTFSGDRSKIEYWRFKCTQDTTDKHKVHVAIIPMESQGVAHKEHKAHETSITISSIAAPAAHHTHTASAAHATHTPATTTTGSTTSAKLNRRAPAPEPEPEVLDLHDFIKRDNVPAQSHSHTSTSAASTPTSSLAAHQRKGGVRSVGCIKLGQEAVSKAREEARQYITAYTHDRSKIEYWRYVCKPDATDKHMVHVQVIPMQSKGVPLLGGVPRSTTVHLTSVAAAVSPSGTATTSAHPHPTGVAKSS